MNPLIFISIERQVYKSLLNTRARVLLRHIESLCEALVQAGLSKRLDDYVFQVLRLVHLSELLSSIQSCGATAALKGAADCLFCGWRADRS